MLQSYRRNLWLCYGHTEESCGYATIIIEESYGYARVTPRKAMVTLRSHRRKLELSDGHTEKKLDYAMVTPILLCASQSKET